MGTTEISQRDLRSRSKEIMDGVERGVSYTVTRDGYAIGRLVPLRPRRTFVSRQDFGGGVVPVVDPDVLKADLDALVAAELGDPYAG